jgi:formamidopyrimidine-DNA glycosylase
LPGWVLQALPFPRAGRESLITMPELPEVETVVRALRRQIKGRKLGRLHIWQPAVIESDLDRFRRAVSNTIVHAIRRRGKWIVFDLERGAAMLAHLRMTGRFRVVESGTARDRHDHVEWWLGRGGERLRFNDPRRFGRLRIIASRDVESYLLRRGWGPEPFAVAPDEFHRRLGKGRRSIKAALLDQSVVAGLGNIYADESLFAAGLDPRTPTARIGPTRARRLHRAMLETLTRAIAMEGTTLATYVSPESRPGRFKSQLQVFRRTGEPCPRCGRAVRRVRLAGRSTHFCTRCQR